VELNAAARGARFHNVLREGGLVHAIEDLAVGLVELVDQALPLAGREQLGSDNFGFGDSWH
jgi:hypothetical protein